MVKVPYRGVPKGEEKEVEAPEAMGQPQPPIRKPEPSQGEGEPPIRRPVKIGDGKDAS